MARALFVYDEFFKKFIINKNILNILNKIFGDKYILNLQNSPINRAHESHYGSTWHRDLSYQHFVPSRPIAISVLICIDPFTNDNGGTLYYPFHISLKNFLQRIIKKKRKKYLLQI